MRLFKALRRKRSDKLYETLSKAHKVKRYTFLIVGTFIYAAAYNLFFYTNNIVYGGTSGISIITKSIISPALMILILDILFLVLSYLLLGKKETINSIIGSLLFPAFVLLTQNIDSYIQIDSDNLLLIALIGGVIIGTASGIIFKSGFTTGGTDVLNQIVSKYLKISIGTSMLLTDGVIVLVGGFFFGWTRVLYALIVLYIINIMVDKVVLGISNNKAVYIITNKDDDIIDYLLNELNLGITLIETRGGYTNKKDQIIMCVVPTSEYFRVSEAVDAIDPKAVILVTDAYQTSGIYQGKGSAMNGIY